MSKDNTTPSAKPEQRQTESVSTRIRPKHQHRRRITPEDAADFAKLMSLRITDAEACGMLGISVTGWRQWRARHPEFEELYAAIRGSKIEAHMSNIENQAPEDWRASQAWLQLTNPERYSARALAFPQESTSITVNVHNQNLWLLAAEKIYGPDALKSPAPTRRALPQATPEAATASVTTLLEVMPKDPRKP